MGLIIIFVAICASTLIWASYNIYVVTKQMDRILLGSYTNYSHGTNNIPVSSQQ